MELSELSRCVLCENLAIFVQETYVFLSELHCQQGPFRLQSDQILTSHLEIQQVCNVECSQLECST